MQPQPEHHSRDNRAEQHLQILEGQNSLLQSKLERAERDRVNLRQELAQLKVQESFAATHLNPNNITTNFTLNEMQKQLESLKRELLFKDQDIVELKRESTQRLERLKEREAVTAALEADLLKVKQNSKPHAAHVDEDEEHRIRPSTRDFFTVQTVSKRRRRDSDDFQTTGIAQSICIAPFLDTTVLEALASESALSTLWSLCSSALLLLSTPSSGREDGLVNEVTSLLPKLNSGIKQPADLLEVLASFISQLTEDTLKRSNIPIAAACFTVLHHLIDADSKCARIALSGLHDLEIGPRLDQPSARVIFLKGDRPSLLSLPCAAGRMDVGEEEGYGPGLLRAMILCSDCDQTEAKSASLQLADALASNLLNAKKVCLLQLLKSGAMSRYLQDKALQGRALSVLQILFADSEVIVEHQAALGPYAVAEENPVHHPAREMLLHGTNANSNTEATNTSADQHHMEPPKLKQLNWAAALMESLLDCFTPSEEACRKVMSLIAQLLEQKNISTLVYLLRDVQGMPLAQRLIHVADAASKVKDHPDAAVMPLVTDSCPTKCASKQLTWWTEIRYIQEALTLLRGLVANDDVGRQALDDLSLTHGASRLAITVLGRLMTITAPSNTLMPPLPLAPWARSIGSSTATAAFGGDDGACRGALGYCSVEDIHYMAKSMRVRILHRFER